jgi:tetratricopeptide (TPR) repeat protein
LHEAEQIYQQILAQQPEHLDATHNLGVIASQVGRYDHAVDLIRRAITLKPDLAEAHSNLGNALKNRGLLDDAIAAYRQAIALRPNYAEAHSNLGSALREKGQLDDAIAAYCQAIVLRPDYTEAHNNLGNALRDRGQLDEAIAAYRQAIALMPHYVEAYNNLGAALAGNGQFDEAVAAFRQAIALRPDLPEAHSNLGNALRDNDQLNDAIAAYHQAIALRPNYAEALTNLGISLADKGELDDAIIAYRRAIQLKPDAADIHWDLAFLLLSMGRFAEGWEEFEWRLKDETKRLRRDFSAPQWNGEALAGKTLLLHAEGGFGDAFQFVRYVPLLRGRAAKMILECDSALVRLFSDLPGIDEIIARGQALPAFDYHIPLQSLPRLFKTDLTNIPNAVPYLKVQPENQASWKARVKNDGRLKVGLVWAGSPRAKISDDLRTRGLDVFAPLGQMPNVRFFSLQKGPESNLARPPGLEMTDFTRDLNDFADTAALIENLDLVISVDTSVAHLAGALAKPVWVLIPFSSDFRWLMDRTDSPWYPTMRLFRQKQRNDWQGVVAEMADALMEASLTGNRCLE